MDTKNFEITIYNGKTGKKVCSYKIFDCTREKAEEISLNAREIWTDKLWFFCDSVIREIK